MSEFARALPFPSREAETGKAGAPRKWGGVWFAWWVAACLVALAFSTYQQLSIQRRILGQSQLLKAKLAESKDVSATTNEQLANVAKLDAATKELAEKLKRVGGTNAALKGELLGLEGTVEGIRRSVGHLGEQALQSHQLLGEIAQQSGTLHGTLLRSHAVGEQVAVSLRRMVQLQEALNADLAEMNRKTKPLERMSGRN